MQQEREKLDPYQIEGAQFLAERPRALLADVMGVGKSAQAVHAAELVEAKRVLVICQGSKRNDWRRDFARWSDAFPNIKRIIRKKDTPILEGVTIVSYDLVESVLDYQELMGVRFDVCIIDEVQFLKAPTAVRTKRILGRNGVVHSCDQVWLLSGTPMLNHPGEMWPWLYTLFPETITIDGKLLDYESYTNRYCVTRETNWGVSVVGGKNLQELKRRIWPITLRRGEEVLADLPSLSYGEIAIERSLVTHPDDIADLADFENRTGGQALRDILVAMEAGRDTDLNDLLDTKGQVSHLRKVTAVAKTKPLCDMLIEELKSFKIDKVVFFAIHRDALRLAFEYFADAGLKPEIIWGGIEAEVKDRRLRRFISQPHCRVFIGQIDAAGTGIDGLQHACANVVFLETSWTPAGNLQAVKRVHRRGQRRAVTVRFAHLTDSLDEQVQKVLHRKTKLLGEIFC